MYISTSSEGQEKNMCGSGYPTNPKFLPPTLNFFSKFWSIPSNFRIWRQKTEISIAMY